MSEKTFFRASFSLVWIPIRLGASIPQKKFKDTCYGLAKISQNQHLMDILACNSANRPSFNKPVHTFLPRKMSYGFLKNVALNLLHLNKNTSVTA